jgi:hypothetical protein
MLLAVEWLPDSDRNPNGGRLIGNGTKRAADSRQRSRRSQGQSGEHQYDCSNEASYHLTRHKISYRARERVWLQV